MKLEYIILFKKDSSFCSNIESLKKFIESDSSFNFKNKTLVFLNEKQKIEIETEINKTEVKEKEQLCYNIQFVLPESTDDKTYTEFNRRLKTNFNKINSKDISINIVWDDFGLQNSHQAYPMINEIENLMRKFISKFMLLNFGMNWFESYMPKEIESKIKDRKQGELYLDYIYKTDFIHLSDFFFKKYRSITINDLDQEISKGIKSKKFNEKILESYLAKSNWERHFANIVVDDTFSENKLLEQWEKLHELRNEVAHNRFVSFSDLSKIKEIYASLKNILEKLLRKAEDITLSEIEKEITLERYFFQKFIRLSRMCKFYNLSLAKIVGVFADNDILIEPNPNVKVNLNDVKIFDKIYGGPSKLDQLYIEYPSISSISYE